MAAADRHISLARHTRAAVDKQAAGKPAAAVVAADSFVAMIDNPAAVDSSAAMVAIDTAADNLKLVVAHSWLMYRSPLARRSEAAHGIFCN